MNATILCSFDSVDLAEIAAGRIRSKTMELQSIEISTPSYGNPNAGHTSFVPMLGGAASMQSGPFGATVAPVLLSEQETRENSDFAPRDATLRIVCSQQARASVEAQLISLGALRLRTIGREN